MKMRDLRRVCGVDFTYLRKLLQYLEYVLEDST